MFINQLNRREKYLALATLSVISIAVIYFLIIGPIFAKSVVFNKEIRSKINNLEKGRKILASEGALKSEYNKLSKDAKSIKNEEGAIAGTLAYIEDVSRNDSCFIANIKPIGTTNLESYKEILIDVTVEAGGIEQLSKFLYDIENPRDNLINIKRLTISSKAGQAGTLKAAVIISKILLN